MDGDGWICRIPACASAVEKDLGRRDRVPKNLRNFQGIKVAYPELIRSSDSGGPATSKLSR